jgi:signal transduction histidine kinase
MDTSPDDWTARPGYLAGVYLLVGLVWVLLTDYLVVTFVESAARSAQLQLVKGWGFVALSAALLYYVGHRGDTRVRETTAELRATLQQTHVLHRILRHNLRNKGNVIVGYASRIAESGDVTGASIIKRKAEELLEVSEQSRILREVSLGEHSTVELDLVARVQTALDDVRTRYPDADLRVELPPSAEVVAHPEIDHAIREVVLNAIEHGDGEVGVRVELLDDGDVELVVTDDGPGFPAMERRVLEEGFIETQTHHSQGLGLWIVRSLLNASDGSLAIESGPDQSTTVQLTFEGSMEGALRRFLR